MGIRRKAYELQFIRVGTEEQSKAIIKRIVKQAVQEVLNKHGAVCHNLDEVLDKYIRPATPPRSAES